ncbi:hypothetical protein [Paenibacillus massiliensis]|uniref:hypothetical protein n=1 Tax=Paenibacillus massiliensis TaxID=225917 RepID=UPI0039C737D3
MEIGRKIYYRKASGQVIFVSSEMSGSVLETTVEEDFEFYPQLQGYDPEKVGMLQLEYGQYADDFSRAASYYVNPETGKLMFNYRNDIGQEPTYEAPLTDQVSELRTRQDSTEQALLVLMEDSMGKE